MDWWAKQRQLVREAPRSKWAVIAGGTLPLVGVLFLRWDLAIVMLAFWMENVVVGIYSILRMAILARWAALFAVPFFTFHYGMFTAVHGFLLYGLLVAPNGLGAPGVGEATRALAVPLGLAFATLMLTHGYSFVTNFWLGGEWKRMHSGQTMVAAYKRVVILHLTIIFGALAAFALGSPVWALIVLVALKVTVDLWSHARDHRTTQGTVDATD